MDEQCRMVSMLFRVSIPQQRVPRIFPTAVQSSSKGCFGVWPPGDNFVFHVMRAKLKPQYLVQVQLSLPLPSPPSHPTGRSSRFNCKATGARVRGEQGFDAGHWIANDQGRRDIFERVKSADCA